MVEIGERRSYVRIITHDSFYMPFELTNADALTQFFLDYNNIRTGVETYIVNSGVDSYGIDLVRVPNYLKKLVNEESLPDIAADPPPPVTFLLCHGVKRNLTKSLPYDPEPVEEHPAFLFFSEDENDPNIVYASRSVTLPDGEKKYVPDEAVILHNLIQKTGLVVILCCAGDNILEDYLSERGNDIPDILVYKCEVSTKLTHAILVALLINLIDSDDRVLKDPAPEEVYNAVRNGIVTILKIVKWCDDDKDVFWKFLLDVGCVSEYETEKQKQGLPRAVSRFKKQEKDLPSYYRVYGQFKHEYVAENTTKQFVFNDFKALTLVSKGVEKPVEQNYQTVEELTAKPTTRTLKEIVYEYVFQNNNNKGTEPEKDRIAFVGRNQIRMLLSELKSMSMTKF
jgi:hypothetical protein